MKKHNRVVFIIGLFLIAINLFAQSDTTSYIADKKLIVRGDSHFPPFEYLNQAGEPEGFSIDLIKAIFEEMDLEYELQLQPWQQVIREVNAGEIDIVVGMINSLSWAPDVRFGTPYYRLSLDIITHQDSAIHTFDHLRGRHVVVQKNGWEHAYLSEVQITDHLILVDNIEEGLNLLAKGDLHAEAVVCSEVISSYMLKKLGYKDMVMHRSYSERRGFSLAVPKDRDELLFLLDMGLYRLKENGVYNQIYEKWFGVYNDQVYSQKILYTLYTVLAIALVFVCFTIFLRKRIRSATLNLREAQRKLLATNKQLELVLSAGNIIPITWSPQTDVIDFTHYNMTGEDAKKSGKISSILLDEFVQHARPLTGVELKKQFQDIASFQIEGSHAEIQYKTKGNDIRYFDLYLLADSVEKKKNQRAVVGYLQGITLRKKAEQELIDAKKELDNKRKEIGLAIDAGQISAWSFDPESHQFTTLHGETIVKTGDPFTRLATLMHPDDWILCQRVFDSLSKGKVHSAHEIFRFKGDGSDEGFYCESQMSTVVNSTGEVVRIVGTQKDITGKLKTQKQLIDYKTTTDFVLQSSGMIKWEYRVESQLLSLGSEIDKFLNLTVLDQEYIALVHPDDREIANSFICKMNSRLDMPLSVEYRIKYPHTDGYIWCVSNAVPVDRDAERRVTIYVGLNRDNTEWRTMTDRLITLREKAEESNCLKSAFLANMSHEIRTPLNAIVGFSSLIDSAENAEERQSFINSINLNSELLLRLISDILDLSKMESGSLNYSYSLFSVNQMCLGVYTTFSLRMPQDVELRLQYSDPDLFINSDLDRIIQVLSNFLSNAIKFTHQGYIDISVIQVDTYVEISVADTGIGISPDKQEAVFERFTKLNDFIQGTGLGLSISRSIIEYLGGTIGVDSQEQQGSKFWIRLPIADSKQEESISSTVLQ